MISRIREWAAETHGAWLELVRHFTARFFDSEMSSTPGQTRKVAIGIISALIPAAVLIYPTFIHRYNCVDMGQWSPLCPVITDYPAMYRVLVRTDLAWLIGLAICVTTMATALRWDSVFPSRRDCLALASFPVSAGELFGAKFTALLLSFAAFVLAFVSVPSLLFGALIRGQWALSSSIAVNGAATFAAMAGACAFTFFTLAALQGVLLAALPVRVFNRVSVMAQSVLFTLGVAAIPFIWREPGPSLWWPQRWFQDLWFGALGEPGRSPQRAFAAIALPAAVALAAYLVSYLRYQRLLLESRRAGARESTGLRLGARLLDRWIADPREQGMFVFIAKTLFRSRTHQLVLQICAGLSLSYLLFALSGTPTGSGSLQFAVLLAPPLLAAAVIAGLRYLFSLPADLAANWLFQANQSACRVAWLKAADRFVVWCGLAPIYLLAVPAAVAGFGWAQGFRVILMSLVIALAMREFWFRDWRKAPFTCSHLPGEHPLWLILPVAFFTMTLLGTLGITILNFSASWVRMAAVLPLELLLYWKLRQTRRQWWEESPLVFDEQPEPVVSNLGLQTERGAPLEITETTPKTAIPFSSAIRATEEDAKSPLPREDRALGPFFALGGMLEDLRFGMRLMRKNARLSATVLATLALGIGVNVSVLTLINGFALRARADHPETFARVVFSYARAAEMARVAPDEYQVYARRSRTLQPLAAFTSAEVTLGYDRSVDQNALLVSCNFFEVYGLRNAKLGRLFTPGECVAPGVAPVVILSEETWQDRFGGNPAIVGQTIFLNDQPFTVIGVAPARHPSRINRAAMWAPYTAQPLLEPHHDIFRNQTPALVLDGRLAQGLSRGAAEAELQVIARQLDRAHPRRRTEVTVTDGSLYSMFSAANPKLLMLLFLVMAAPWAVLLIACANVTTLLLSRAVARRREIAVRLSLGAPRMRLLRMLLVESLLLAGAAGAVALWLANHVPALLYGFLAHEPPDFPVAPDARIFAFVFGVVAAIGCLAGLAPAFESLRVDLTTPLRGCDPAERSAPGIRLRSLLVSVQVALGLVLLVSAGLIARMDYRSYGVDRGIDPAHILAARLRFPAASSANDSLALYRDIEGRLRQLPNVRSVSNTDMTPLLGMPQLFRLPNLQGERTVVVEPAFPAYLATLGIPIVMGRDFHDGDQPSGNVIRAIVSQSFAKTFSPGRYPVGQQLQVAGQAYLEIIGVARDIASGEDALRVYEMPSWNPRGTILVIRFTGDLRAAAHAVQSAVQEAGRQIVISPRTLQSVLDDRHEPEMRIVMLLASLGLVALLLAISGIHGVVSFWVTQRTREWGIRSALGATRLDLARAVILSGARPLAYGLFIGLWLSLITESAVKQIFANSPMRLETGDPLVYLSAALLLAGAALAAMYSPARRAGRSDPSKALRYE